MRNSAEFQAIVLQTYSLAGQELRKRVEGKAPGTWAVALDADETLISNLDYEKELVRLGRESTDELWVAWVAKQAAEPLPGALEFLGLVQELGGHIAVVTNRKERDCPDTRANLEAFEIPFDVLLCRTDDREKEPRWARIENGTATEGIPAVEIVMWLGDNINDFPGMTQESRFSSPEAFEEYGTRFFVFPNPSYGSWQANPFD
jgi:5'-nucleotidase (lipoprotein e(P4) family)